MKCSEPMTVSELSSLISVGSWTTAALQLILDGATDFLFSLLGHSFGRAIRIYHDESEDATAATVSVTATGIVLVITGGANAGTYSYDFATYSDLTLITDAIEQEDVGFVVSIVEGMPSTEKTENLHALAATGCLGLTNRQVLCMQYTTEIHDGIGEPMVFTRLPIKSVVSVVQDGTTVTDYWTKQNPGYLIYKYCTGSQYTPYSVDLWSVKSPCNLVIRFTPLWLRIPGAMKLALRALCQDIITSTGFKSESLGDYSYSKNGWSAIGPFWTLLADYMVQFQP